MEERSGTLLSAVDAALVPFSEMCGFGGGLRLLPFPTRAAAILQVRTMLAFAFFPVLLGLLVAIAIDRSAGAAGSAIFGVLKSAEVFPVSIALLAPVWHASRDESNVKGKSAFIFWVVSVLVVGTVMLVLPRLGLAVRPWLYAILALGVLVLTTTLLVASTALSEGIAGGSVPPSTTEEDQFAAEFQKRMAE
jgi:hypothetical protein